MASDVFNNITASGSYVRVTNDFGFVLVVRSVFFEDIDEFSFDINMFGIDGDKNDYVFSNVSRETLEAIRDSLSKVLEESTPN